VDILEQAEQTVRDLANTLEMRVGDVLDDLRHVRRTVGKRLQVRPARCTRCDFVFRKRSRLSTPSRCPRCRCEQIDGPWLRIAE
jgi:predicted Zn-ribbon and HTH transcriptional regulator